MFKSSSMFICSPRASGGQVHGVVFFFFCYTFRCVEGGSGRWVAAALTRVERTKTAQVCKYMYVHISVCIYLYRPHKPVVRSSV